MADYDWDIPASPIYPPYVGALLTRVSELEARLSELEKREALKDKQLEEGSS